MRHRAPQGTGDISASRDGRELADTGQAPVVCCKQQIIEEESN
jgi:hypothetical protein